MRVSLHQTLSTSIGTNRLNNNRSPISVGSRRDFAKPGIDTLQQGYVYASGERDRERDGADAQTPGQPHKNLPQLAYSSVGINLRSGRHRVKDDSRANYGDIIEIDHEAQVMVIGDVAKYFDRVRKNVNKAFMRGVLREALGPYCQRKKSETAAAGAKGWGNSAVTLAKVTQDQGPALEDIAPEDTVVPDPIQVDGTRADGGAHLGRDGGESIISDGTKDDDDEWDASSQQASPIYATAPAPAPAPAGPSDERRARRAASRARYPEHGGGTPVRAGMDRAGLSSLRSLRQSLPGGDDYDDTRSLRSLAMVGRSHSDMPRRSGR